MSTTVMGTSSNYWEDLRKQARQLENELDLKLVSFSKLCTSYRGSHGQQERDCRSESFGPFQDNMLVAMTSEVEQLLSKLSAVNDKMAEYTNTPGALSHNAALMHTLQRHRDILQDYTHEFHKTKSNFLSLREREDLLGSVHRDIESYKNGSGVNNRRSELFLKEHEHLRKQNYPGRGSFVSQDERKVFGNYSCTVPQEQTDPDGKVEHEEQSRMRQTEDICRFANYFNNSWMSAGFQSVLNLSVTRRCLAQRHLFKEASSIPNCASLIHTAVHQPGYYFSPEEISPVLMELREREPSPELGKQFEISCLLESVLVWLDSFGGSTDREMYCKNTCTGCGTSFLQLLNNGPIVVLPSSTSLNDTASLFNNWINLWGQPDCSSCRSGLNRKNVLSSNNVIVLFLPRWVERRYPVTPSPTMEVPGESGTELYCLSSVICGDAESAHFYTYLIRGQQTVKVVDEYVLTAGKPCREDMYKRGFIYVYEKRANTKEPHSDHLNTPSVTVSPGPPLQNDDNSSGEEPEPLNLEEQNSTEDETSGHIE